MGSSEVPLLKGPGEEQEATEATDDGRPQESGTRSVGHAQSFFRQADVQAGFR